MVHKMYKAPVFLVATANSKYIFVNETIIEPLKPL